MGELARGFPIQPAIPRRNKCIALGVVLPQMSMPRGSRDSDAILALAEARAGANRSPLRGPSWKRRHHLAERGGPRVALPIGDEGFGDLLVRATVTGQPGGNISREWKPEGLVLRLSVPRQSLTS